MQEVSDSPETNDPAPTPPPRLSPPPPPPPPPSSLTPPPGYVAYQGHATPSQNVRRIGGLATVIAISTAVVAAGTFIATLLSASVSTDATDFLAGSMTKDDFQSAIVPLNSVQLLVSVATLTTGVLTIMWMFRIASNVRAFGRATTWSPLFAIFGWFLPPMVLYIIPFLVLRELWKASEPTAADGSDDWKRTTDTPLLWAWFVLFGILPAILLAIQIGSFATGGLPTGDIESVAKSLDDFGAIGYVTAFLNIAAAVVWIRFVRQLTQRHKQLTNES